MKKILLQLFLFSSPFTIIIPLLIVLFDPYSLHKENYSENIGSMNERFVKMRYLVNTKTDFNAFLFGSSRVGNMDTRLITDVKCYNMTCSGSLPSDWLHDLTTLLEAGYPIKKVFIGIDDISYQRPSNYNEDILFRRAYETNQLKNTAYYFRYIFRIPKLSELKNAIIGNEKYNRFPIQYDIYANGIPLKKSREDYIEQNMAKHIHDKIFQWDGAHYAVANYKADCLKNLLQLKELCNKHQIECIFFINPIYKAKYLTNDPEHFIDFKRSLAQQTNFWDFSGLNTVTTNPYYWFERSHYRMNAGDLMIHTIYKEQVSNDPAFTFGKYITSTNCDSVYAEETKVLTTYIKK